MTVSLHCRLLREAAALLGGRVQLGHELQVPAQDLARWMAGLGPMPQSIFLKVVDLILDVTSERAAAPVGAPLSCSGDVRRMGQRTKGGERDAG